MTIRSRLLWWSTGLGVGGLLLLLGFAYFEFVHEHPEFLRNPWDATKRRALLHSLKEVALFAGLPSLLLMLGGLWWLHKVRQAFEPLEALTRAAERINIGNLGEALPQSGNRDEIDRLVTVLNDANRRVAAAVEQIREFTLHASHELKTPLAVLRAGVDSSLSDGQLTAQQRELAAEQLAEIDRLTQIVEALTFLARADANLIQLRTDPVDFSELVREAAEDAEILAHPHQVQVRLVQCEPVTLKGDRHRLRQLLLNLTENAIKYNHPGGMVDLSLRRNGDRAEFVVVNTGPGLAPEHQPRVFERFFRGDPARSRDIEGSGLGLSIARWIVRQHEGNITFHSQPGGLTTVATDFPVSPAAK